MSISRDAHGIPHVVGDDVLHLAGEQGRATAQDRRWQLEVDRLRAEGRTAALVGPGGAGWDTFARQARIAETARRAFVAADPQTRALCEAYVSGVRAELPTAAAPELEALGEPPGEWQPWTPMAIWLVHHVLFGSWGHHLWWRRVVRVLGEEGRLLFGVGSDELAGGSNAFVIGGDLTASGLPIVAGDPHRLFETPNVYAQVRLTCPDFDVAGLAFPGVPGVQHFGHAVDVAWAVTNAMADQQHLVDVPLAECGEAHEWLEVRGSDPVQITVRTAGPGPVLVVDGDVACCLAAPSYDDGSPLDAVLPLLRSRSVGDVDRALERWVEPANNVLIADTSGRTLHRVAGCIPGRHDGSLPRIEGGPDGVLVSANDRVSEAFDVLGDRFAPPHRAERLRRLLAEPRRWTPADAAAVLGDVQLGDATLLDRIAALDDDDLTARARQSRTRLLGWDRRFAVDSRGAALLAEVRDRVVDGIAASSPLASLRDAAVHGDLWVPWLWLPGRLASALDTWLRAERPLGIDVAALVGEALDVDPDATSAWGSRHRYRPLHALTDLGRTDPDPPEADGPPGFDPEVAGRPLDGDTDCVAATKSLPGSTDSLTGPVVRYVWALGDHRSSRWAVPLGASGDPASPHHCDQFDAWATCGLVPVAAPGLPVPSCEESS